MVTFGCKANQYDTPLLREALGRRGQDEAGEDQDLVVINTCTVTANAGKALD
jgi:tRNA A37 methylthiotransferase MiaB